MASSAVGGPHAGGIGEAPLNASRNSRRGHSRTQSSSASTPASPSALDKFVRALLPQSAFPSHLAHYPGEVDGIAAKHTIAGGTDLSRTSPAASSTLHPFSEPTSPSGPVLASSPSPGKSRNRVPTSTIGAGKAAHAHRHNLSIDSSSESPMASVTRTRSKTGVTNSSAARTASPASFQAGGIGESPARSRQNSASSSVGSTNLASSMFSHRQTSSTSTQQDPPTLKSNKAGPSRLNSASTSNTIAPAAGPVTAATGNSTLPSIRGYTTFPNSINLSSARPRTPLLDPFMRYPPGQSTSSGPSSDFYTGNEAPQIRTPIDEPGPSNSYVASLALAPLVSRPTQGGQPLYIAGGRTPDTLHAAPSSTYSTPNLHSSPAMQFTSSGHTMPRSPAVTGLPASRNGRGVDDNAGLGLAPSASASTSQARPGIRHRSSSVDSYLPREEGQNQDSSGHDRKHNRQHSSGLAGFTNFFHLRNLNSEDKSESLSRRRSSRDNNKSRSRKGSLSNTVNTGQSGKISSRFVHYGQPSPGSRPRTPASETRTRQRSSSFGGAVSRDYEFPGRESPTQVGASSSERGRLPRGDNPSRANSGVTASSSLGRRQEEKRKRNKLVSARLPETISHRDARLPSQPLGITWICGSSTAARTPSFYDEFDYSKFPGGKRKRSMSRSTITQRNYSTTTGGLNSRAGSRNGTRRGSDDLAYESEPEFLARRRARNAGDANASRTKEAAMVDEQTQTTPQGELGSGAMIIPHLTFPSGTGALLTSQEEERALRRRSHSLVNLRRDVPHDSRYGRSNDGHTKEYNNNLKGMISQPYRDFSNEFIRTPRTAPIPSPGPGEANGSDVPPLFMGDSALAHDQYARRYEERNHPSSSNAMTGVGSGTDLTSSLRRAPSKASIEAIEDPDKRREALFAALPPPARRSPIPPSAFSPSMYATGKVLSPDPAIMQPSGTQYGGYVDYPSFETQEELNLSANRSGAMSPPVEDYSQFEASRVIIGQSDLLSSAAAQERFPIVYGQAFSTTHESHEGEILSASTSHDELYAGERLQRETSRQSGVSRDSLTPLRDVESSMTMQRRQDNSSSAGSENASASRSISNGSARILDLNEESFTNLFFKAPPPSKPLPSLPSSDSNSLSLGGSGSRLGSTPSPARDTREISPAGLDVQAEQRRPDSMTVSDRFPTPDFSVLNTFDFIDGESELNEDGLKRDSRRETLTHPFARVAAGHPNRTVSGTRALDDDWANVDDGFLRGDRQVWPPVEYDDDEDEVLLQPPPMARNFTNSTARTMDTFYTAGGPSNASNAALQAPSLSHQDSFASARSHITASSAARTPQAEINQPTLFTHHRGQFIDDSSDDDELQEYDALATMRRTDLSPIYVQRPGIPSQLLQQHSRETSASPATGSNSQPTSARLSNDEAFGSNRESFIEFEPVIPIRRRAASDTRSFIDDSDSDDDERPRTTDSATGPASTENNKINRPSVIVEHLHEDEQGASIVDNRSPDQATSLYSPLYAATSPSHYSVTPSEIISSYDRGNDGKSGGFSRDSQGNFSLGLPNAAKGADRSSGGSHTHSVSNVSILSSLSRLEDFPEPPPSITPAYEKDEATAMMQRHPSVSRMEKQEAPGNTLRPRGSSLPGGVNNQSRATINTQGTQTTSTYTFTSFADGSGKDNQAEEEETHTNREDADRTILPKRMFEFPMRRDSSKRTTVDSFLDTTTSPERGSRSSPSLPRLDSSFSSASQDLTSPTVGENIYTPSPSQQSFRLSGIFSKRPIKHERISSDPTALKIVSSRNSSLHSSRRDSGGFDNKEEKRQSWKGF